jgi:hypothetical protein
VNGGRCAPPNNNNNLNINITNNNNNHRQIVKDRIKRRNDKLDQRITQALAVNDIQLTEINKYVSNITYITDNNVKDKLQQHLNEIIVNKKQYKFVDQDSLNEIKNSVEYKMYEDTDTGSEEMKDLFNRLLCTNDNKEVDRIVNEINTLYIPGFIEKDSVAADNKLNKDSNKDSKDEVNSGEEEEKEQNIL